MSITFTVRGPSKETVSAFYYHFYRSLLKAVADGPELELLHRTEDGCERSFALKNAGIPELREACSGLDLQGCQVVSPAEYSIPEPVVEELPVEEEPAAVEEEPVVEAEAAVVEVETVPVPAKRRGRRTK